MRPDTSALMHGPPGGPPVTASLGHPVTRAVRVAPAPKTLNPTCRAGLNGLGALHRASRLGPEGVRDDELAAAPVFVSAARLVLGQVPAVWASSAGRAALLRSAHMRRRLRACAGPMTRGRGRIRVSGLHPSQRFDNPWAGSEAPMACWSRGQKTGSRRPAGGASWVVVV